MPVCRHPDLPEQEPADTLTIPGTQVTHVCCSGDGGFTAEHVARCARIPHVAAKPEDVLDQVDAVIVATDIGAEHVARCRPFDESMRVNGTGLILVTRALGELVADGGAIINIGSIMGLVGVEPANYNGTEMNGWYPDYFFHKGGMANLTRFVASYYGPRGIRVNCVHPGGLRMPSQPAAFVRNYSARTCLGRLASDTDLMGVVVFLASDASAYVTGTNIPVDGGYTAK